MKELSGALQAVILFTVAAMCVILVVNFAAYVFSTPEIIGYYPKTNYIYGDTPVFEIRANVKNGEDFIIAMTSNYDEFRGMMKDFRIPVNNEECKK
jgi:hypothetical protein